MYRLMLIAVTALVFVPLAAATEPSDEAYSGFGPGTQAYGPGYHSGDRGYGPRGPGYGGYGPGYGPGEPGYGRGYSGDDAGYGPGGPGYEGEQPGYGRGSGRGRPSCAAGRASRAKAPVPATASVVSGAATAGAGPKAVAGGLCIRVPARGRNISASRGRSNRGNPDGNAGIQ